MDQFVQPNVMGLVGAPMRTLADMERAGMIIEHEGRTRLGDEFRIAASRLQNVIKASIAAGEKGANMLLVTSTRPAEGKSFSAVNIAAALAQTSPRPVVLVDADAKPGCLSELLGLKGHVGLLDLAADSTISAATLIVETPVAGLSVLPLGTSTGIPGPRSQPLPSAAEQIGRSVPGSIIVLDTGPLLSTSDPSVLAPSVAQVVMIVEAERTQRTELDAALELIRSSPRVMLLLNKVAGRHRSSFGAYSYSGDYYAKPNLPPPIAAKT